MTNECFADTVCSIALLNHDDEFHESADMEYRRLLKKNFRVITTTAVLNEVANALSKPPFRESVTAFYKRLQDSQRVEIIFVDKDLWNKGWELYRQRPDKEWSLTDCISIEVMRERKLKDVLTNDRHFTQAGFNIILRKKKSKSKKAEKSVLLYET
jgi:predicted nucleic acid-binding protein